MGMGEPMMNYKNVVEAIHKITKPEGLGMSPRKNYRFYIRYSEDDQDASG